jgi:hypothetical protein
LVLASGLAVTAKSAKPICVTRQFVDRHPANGVLEFRRLAGSKHRRVKVGDVLALQKNDSGAGSGRTRSGLR